MSNTFFSTKSILSFFLVLLFAFSLTACSLDDIEQLETDSDNDEDFNITDTCVVRIPATVPVLFRIFLT